MFFLLLCALPALVLGGGQVPVVDGVIGGVSNATFSTKFKTNNVLAANTTNVRVTENSGICETTPGVYQASGYVDIATDKSIFFWYFASRNDPDTAPLSLWFNGGPGSSSMIGLLQELGPCRINNDTTTVSLNPWAWNTNSNVLFIDQPVGVGFSHGTLDVGTSQAAAADIYTFLQIFLADSHFSDLADKDLALWTESYGGHYGPTFASYFLDQNTAIADGSLAGITLNLKTLGVGDGLTDPLNQYHGYIEYAASNPYHPLVSNATINTASTAWSESNGCQEQITKCYNNGSNSVCSAAQSFCNDRILSPLAGNYDVYYILSTNPDPYPPALDTYLASVSDSIGAEATWQETNDDVYSNFASTGDWMRSSAIDLGKVIAAGIRTVVYVGDADYILNFNGIENYVGILSSGIANQTFESFTVDGEAAGMFKNFNNLSLIRVFGAGHEVPAYEYGSLERGQAAFQMFTQVMAGGPLSGT